MLPLLPFPGKHVDLGEAPLPGDGRVHLDVLIIAVNDPDHVPPGFSTPTQVTRQVEDDSLAETARQHHADPGRSNRRVAAQHGDRARSTTRSTSGGRSTAVSSSRR